uniref:Protein Atg16l2 n=1 Tax=Phascolarctos cinereus TaxID=38626 RepID=A0A6P5KLE7_PHACI|nr:autophagy-related protein 16-2 isoform X3 [Phascolarctos cinereus]XP_020845286.1 autophagy-related protein 16-2 isoform X3 [Phascolarctos cinereus]XP_020845287.1 autophagy-related protein 16-2 isoform X3 [Phascolarctos cinereus]XP_020845288.1 autophagy-related protein 16-2 isoform X3 [Phascolarctos cinereus]XP_020845289.1 autophagy-related protein 16-2 isoform X3 [Phascolarctos cinereus]XP_020845290.1 autophagy-related protein 16-2 isoform X3 [Phascolarctos cinereus]XP_020845291.1 autophag
MRGGPTDHRLLEKSDLLAHFTEKLPPESPSEPSREEEEAGPMPDPTQSPEDLKRKWEEELAKIKLICGEMAYQVVEKHMTLSSQDAMLEDQQGRLSSLDARVCELEETRQWLAEQVAGQQDRIMEGKEAYDTLWAHTGHQEGALRQLEEEGRELVERLIQVKVQAAEAQNYRNERIERVKQARVSKELKKAVRRTVNISETLDPPSIAEPPANKQELLVVEAYEKQWKRPFRSASATSMTLARCMDVMKGLLDFRKRRGHSVSGAPEARYPSIRVCGVSCLPARAQDIQEAHCSEVNAVCFSSNSSLLATGGADRLIRLWNVIGGRLEADQMLEGAGGSVTSLEFEPSGCYLLAATYNKAAQLWKVGESQSKETLSGHTDKVTAAKFKLTRQQAVTGSRDRTVKEWDLNKVSCSRTLDGLSYCNDVVCGDHLIISGHNDQKIRFWDSRVPRCIQVIPVEGKVTSLSISNDQMHLLSCSRDDALKVIDLRVNNIRQVFRADGFKCGSDWTKAVFSPDKSYALAGSADGGLYIWNLESGKLESSLYGPHSVSINAVAWCYAGTHVVSVDQGKKAVLWS